MDLITGQACRLNQDGTAIRPPVRYSVWQALADDAFILPAMTNTALIPPMPTRDPYVPSVPNQSGGEHSQAQPTATAPLPTSGSMPPNGRPASATIPAGEPASAPTEIQSSTPTT